MRTVPVLLANGKQKLQVNALLDDCSTKTYLNADVAAELGLEDVQCMNVSVLNGENKQSETRPVTMTLKNLNEKLKTEITAFAIENVTGNLKAVTWCELKLKWKHVNSISFPPINSQHVDMLIGIDYLNLHQSLKEIRGKPEEPIARLTPLGWTCIGCVLTIDRDYTNYAYFLHDAERDVMRSINNSSQKFWQIDECDSSEIPTSNTKEKRALGVVEKSLI